MAVYFSKYKGLGSVDNEITRENYKTIILKIGISKLRETLVKGHQFYSANIEHYNTDTSIRETINDYLNDLNRYIKTLSKKKQDELFKEDKGYSGHKWTGTHYKQARNLKTSEIAALIKKELDIEFECVAKFSVISDVFTGGSSIRVGIKDVTFNPYNEDFLKALESGQTIHEYNQAHKDDWNRHPERFNEDFKKFINKVEVITNKYNFDDSDSQTDYFHVNYYDSVSFDEDNYLLIHFPNNPDAKRKKEWDEHWNKQKANSKTKVDANKGKFKKGEIVFYNAQMHSSWEKFKLPNGMYLAKIVKSPNGRARFSSYDIRILEDISALKDSTVEYLKKNGADKFFINNEYGTFYLSNTITGYEEKMIAFDAPEIKAATTANKKIVANARTKNEAKTKTLIKKIKPKNAQTINSENEIKVTVNNYLQQRFDTNAWPENFKKVHEFIIGETEGVKNMELYVEDESIRALIDKHISYLNLFLNQQNKKDNHEKNNTKNQNNNAIKLKKQPDSKQVKQVSLSVKFIKRYANLNGKTMTEKQLSAFIKALQRAILSQQIRLTDPHAEMIKHIQNELVKTYNECEPNNKLKFTIQFVDKYKNVGSSETQQHSSTLLKRYVSLIGNTDKEKQRTLYNEIDLFLKKNPSDILVAHLKRISASLLMAMHGNGKVKADEETLSGLQGLGFIPMMIAAAVGKGIEHLAHKALKPKEKPKVETKDLGCACKGSNKLLNVVSEVKAKEIKNILSTEPYTPTTDKVESTTAPKTEIKPTIKKSNNDVMSVSQALNLKFDLIGLEGAYLKLIGEACRPTSFFIYGPGGSGKSTFTLLFGNYMAQKGNRVLYIAGEQHGTPVFTKMLQRLKIKDTDKFVIVKHLNSINTKDFDIVVIDSKDSLGYELENFKQQREQYPHLSFVILSQGTKSGTFTGTEKWRNEVDTLIYCESMIAYTNRDKNRWGGSAEIKINSLIPKN